VPQPLDGPPCGFSGQTGQIMFNQGGDYARIVSLPDVLPCGFGAWS
jgi:hypothetical protein